jgi:hypothetical protein
MTIDHVISQIDSEIARLEQARALLSHGGSRARRPNAAAKAAKPLKRRVLSASARRKIAAAQKKRWAATKQAKADKKLENKAATKQAR